MKLYAWQPKGHGELSFFVMAETLEEAKAAVEKVMTDKQYSDYDCSGWGTDYYTLNILDAGQVAINCND